MGPTQLLLSAKVELFYEATQFLFSPKVELLNGAHPIPIQCKSRIILWDPPNSYSVQKYSYPMESTQLLFRTYVELFPRG
jgi:hypothetical protein